MEPWKLADALQLIRVLQPDTRQFGYHLCLGGGVLNKGESKKDLDLFFLPLDNGTPPELEKLVAWLNEMWGEPQDLHRAYGALLDEDPDDPGAHHAPAARVYQPEGIRWLYEPQPFVAPAAAETQASPTKTYKAKLKYVRGSDRIDVFIV